MLRQRVKVNESDRFIAARSLEREIMIERYKIIEESSLPFSDFKRSKTFKSASPKMRTPLIIKDKKQISEKLYLSLLKTQLLKKSDRVINYTEDRKFNLSNKKRKRDSFTISLNKNNENQEQNNFTSYLNEETPVVDNSNFTNIFSTPNRNNINGAQNRKDGYLNHNIQANSFCKSLFSSSQLDGIKRQKLQVEWQGNIKNSFKDLVDFSVNKEDNVTSKYLNNKNIHNSAYKILDAPGLKDDFYLHLLDWSASDILAVGLEHSVYLWEHNSGTVALLKTYQNAKVTAVKWLNKTQLLIVGLNSGKIEVIDVQKNKLIVKYTDHLERVGVIADMNSENSNLFSSGSLDHLINNYDIRQKTPSLVLSGHQGEICGLQWSHDGKMLASGGNDNKLLLWTLRKSTCEKKFTQHKSAVKALGWSYQKLGLLASGGGTQDRTIKFWNTKTMSLMEDIETDSQVCNIAFSKISNQFVTTHGFSDNLILVWDYEKLDVVSNFKGHRERVIYMSTSPDGKRIVTGAGDETVRFWNVFTEPNYDHNSPVLNKDKFKFR